ncbi:MAG: penicillin-binding transpeptidase domain-containing protein, partial [Planctomycetota bacterium]|nr:penicillin-binding transpeptidase domain-containing protein [Planctomycetota bacterium]
LSVRLFQVQVLEHEVWAREATNLVRSGEILPFRRGRILDRTATRELVRDEETYRLEFVWRDFRREHPLGQVTHAYSLLLGRPVTLDETMAELEPRALELLRLGPREEERFIAGGALFLAGASSGESAEPVAERRAGRAADARFYIERLLGLDREQRRDLRELARDPEQRSSWLELAATISGEPVAELEERLQRELGAARFHLSLLAERLGLEDLSNLVSLLEARRTQVADAVAADLFLQAAGFRPWRLRPSTLAGVLDLQFIARRLDWDGERLAAWIASQGEAWERWLNQGLAPRILAELRVGTGGTVGTVGADEQAAERMHLALLAPFLSAAAAGREGEVPVVLPRLGEIFVGATTEGEYSNPFRSLPAATMDNELQAAARLAGLLAWPASSVATSKAQALLALMDTQRRVWHAAEQELLAQTLGELDGRLKDAIDSELERLLRGAARIVGTSSTGRLRLRPELLKLARDRAPYVIRDRGSRPRLLQAAPDFDVVYLLSRHPERYGGFGVRRSTRRVAVAMGPQQPLAAPLIGKVRQPYLVDLLRQRSAEAELADLRRQRLRSERDEQRVEELVRELLRAGQVQGGFGLEGYLEQELSGRNGYAETQGLAERADRAAWYLEPEDGRDVVTTLDLHLQLAAENVLAEPQVPWGDPKADLKWFEQPVGAIVLMSPRGDLLAAASAPGFMTGEPVAGEGGVVRERTLTRPTFQPPGSVFKPFVAAWCMERGHINGADVLEACAALEDRAGFGWRTMACHTRSAGHGPLALEAALQVSCNAYFAQLGENLGRADWEGICRAFGFGEPSGVRLFDGEPGRAGRRSGLLEQAQMGLLAGEDQPPLSSADRRRAANGLAVVEATPVQIARAYAGLATGELPAVRLVRAVDGEELPVQTRPVGLAQATLDEVRRALASVVTVGSARGKGLDQASLGFTLAAKTGSADYRATAPGEPVRKHTWIAGWFPADDPVAIVTVFLHDTSATSSHSAVYLASQFLRDPAVAEYVQRAHLEQSANG